MPVYSDLELAIIWIIEAEVEEITEVEEKSKLHFNLSVLWVDMLEEFLSLG